MPIQLDITGLTDEQVNQLQVIIEAFQAKNKLDTKQKILTEVQPDELKNNQTSFATTSILAELMENPLLVEDLRLLTREEIYHR